MASHASDDEEADLLTFDMRGFILNKAKEQETRCVNVHLRMTCSLALGWGCSVLLWLAS